MKAIYNRAFFELFFSGERLVNDEAPQSYKCPFCDEMGFTAEELQVHVVENHGEHADGPALVAILMAMNQPAMTGKAVAASAQELAGEEDKGECATARGSILSPGVGSGQWEI